MASNPDELVLGECPEDFVFVAEIGHHVIVKAFHEKLHRFFYITEADGNLGIVAEQIHVPLFELDVLDLAGSADDQGSLGQILLFKCLVFLFRGCVILFYNFPRFENGAELHNEVIAIFFEDVF